MSRFWSILVVAVGMLALAFPASAGAATALFTDGVASGDVTSTRAILWTRVDRADANLKVEVWPNASCLEGQKAFQKSNVRSSAANDFTVKVDAAGLRPGTEYCYRFRRGGNESSPTGRFMTAPAASTKANVDFTYTGDSDGTRVGGVPAFNNFETLDRARGENANFWVYNGDTIYADSRFRSPAATTLPQYRAAYRENRTIAALPNLLQATSTYALMDDHEVANDYDGQTVDPALYAAGRKAFLEYMPVRPSRVLHDPSCAGDPLYGTFKWGSEVELFVLDERPCRSGDAAPACDTNPAAPGVQADLGPTVPTPIRSMSPFNFFLRPTPPDGCLAAIFDPSRTMLGPVQKQKFKDDLLASTAKHKIVISELAFQQFFALPYDRWEGYGAERNELLNFIRDNAVGNVTFLTTDNHANLVNQVYIDRFENCPDGTLACAQANPPTTIANELITGPIATDTLQVEAFNAFGALGVFAFNQILDVAGLDCRNLNKYSYGLVQENANAGTITITLKDDTGANVVDQANPSLNCMKVFGP
jgi:alkaline phosphatase D